MYDAEQDASRTPEQAPPCVPRHPPLRLAGIDEDETFEPHLVRGID
ncbi:hypothetical protein [Streptomyces sp. B93]|nr:hypothetical protein [Streptomyces sp. B93]MBQ1094313.1 hypothetical protein [Streptomyces sp. B93]